MPDTADVHPWRLQCAVLRVQYRELGHAGYAPAACCGRLELTRLPHIHCCSQPDCACELWWLWHHAHVRLPDSRNCVLRRRNAPNRSPLSPRRYAYGAQSVKCAVCNFVTQARPPHVCASTLVHIAHWRRAGSQGGATSTLPPPGSAGGACAALPAFALSAPPCTALTPGHASGSRPQPRPQMVVVENPPTVDDEGKMARARIFVCTCFPKLRLPGAGVQHGRWRGAKVMWKCVEPARFPDTSDACSPYNLRLAAHALQRALAVLRHLPVQCALFVTRSGGVAHQPRLVKLAVHVRAYLEVSNRVPPPTKWRVAHGAQIHRVDHVISSQLVVGACVACVVWLRQ